ncbi:hypothetical protein [Knoellia flava]|uniref:hypothetical protein n=1 Tax=Knoellia flava TaxID=913969 RepID=UPI0012ECA3F8|nr:hypothetical protein [Knoellia flava]
MSPSPVVAAPTARAGPLVVVLGASGGVGGSTWSAALARRLAVHFGSCVLVDGDVRGGGLDMTCGTEHVPGLRWPDLARLRGRTSGARLVAALPRGEVPLLSAGGDGAGVPDEAVLDVVDSLLAEGPMVVDGRFGASVTPALVDRAASVHLLVGLGARQLADANAVLGALAGPAGPACGSVVGVVTRDGQRLAPQVAEVVECLGVSHLAHLRDDMKVRRDGERGEWPGLRGVLRDTADAVALDLVEGLDRGAA